MTEIKKPQSDINDLKVSLEQIETVLEENIFKEDIKIEKKYRNKQTKYGIIKDTKEILMDQKNVNIYRLNILTNIILIIENKTIPLIFLTKLNISNKFFSVPTSKLKKNIYRICFGCPLLWNNILRTAEKPRKSSKSQDYHKGKISFNNK